jgi:hypothetical protein
VSDLHTVISHPETPPRDRTVYIMPPMFAPCAVTTDDTPNARLPTSVSLRTPTSIDHPWLLLALLSPMVATSRRVPIVPNAALHITDVSELHIVDSHPVRPVRAPCEWEISPRPDPCNVTWSEPVPAPFARRITLTPLESHDHAALTLPPLCPTVSIDRRVPCPPCPTRHCIDDADFQLVASHAVRSMRTRDDST